VKKIFFLFILFFAYLFFGHRYLAVNTAITAADKNNVTLQESFQVTAKITEGSINANYFIKCRVGSDSSHLTEGQTFNPSTSEWLNDNGAWSKMPQITLNSTGFWEGTINCRVKDGSAVGAKVAYIRACLNISGACDDFFQSTESVSINVTSASPTDTSSPPQAPSPALAETASPPTITLTPQSYNNVYLSEFMVDPETGNNEWIEIYNENEFDVNLNDWYIDDLENSGSTIKKFSLTVPAKSYASYELSSSVFNNSGDNVRLLDYNQKEIDSYQYETSEKGKTLARTSFDNDKFCLQIATKNSPNGSCLNPPSSSIPNSTTSSSPTITLSKTPSVTLFISKSRSTITSTKISFFTQSQPVVSDPPAVRDEEVLGLTSENQSDNNNQNRGLLTSLTFASFSYSLLSIISILIKVKTTS